MTERNKPKKEFSLIYNEILDIISSIKTTQYKFMDEDEFKKLKELNKIQYIYWSEIIQRAHFCGTTSLQRVLKWMSSINDAWNNTNYYSFCAALRGLIEACSDSFYTISKVIEPIAENFSFIEKALNLKAELAILSEEIENELIHYMYARKLNSIEKNNLPGTHKALQVTQYLNHIGDEDIKSLYSELCQVFHPSMMSLAPFVISDENELFLHNQDVDSTLNQNLLNRYRSKILLAIKAAVMPSIGLLKIISKLNAEAMNSLKFDSETLNSIDDSEFWKELEQKIIDSNKQVAND